MVRYLRRWVFKKVFRWLMPHLKLLEKEFGERLAALNEEAAYAGDSHRLEVNPIRIAVSAALGYFEGIDWTDDGAALVVEYMGWPAAAEPFVRSGVPAQELAALRNDIRLGEELCEACQRPLDNP